MTLIDKILKRVGTKEQKINAIDYEIKDEQLQIDYHKSIIEQHQANIDHLELDKEKLQRK